MKYRMLGKTGYKVSEIGYGAWQLGGQWGERKDSESIAALNLAIDKGVNFIDTAGNYGFGKSERIISDVLKNRKEKVYVCTKIQPQRHGDEIFHHPTPYDRHEEYFSEKYLRENLSERMKMLNVDKIDIILLHSWTRAWNDDPRPIEILHKLKKEGLVGNIGISAPPHDQNSVVQLVKQGMLDVVEVVFNIFNQEAAAEIIPASDKNNTGLIIRIPFEEGALTGKYNQDTKFEKGYFGYVYFGGDRLERTLNRVDRLKEDLGEIDLSMPEVALQFILNQKTIGTVIPGMSSAKHVEANTGVSDLEPLSEEMIERLKKHMWIRTNWIFE